MNVWIAHFLPDREFHLAGPDGVDVYALDDAVERSALVSSMRRFADVWTAPLIREHAPQAFALGYVRAIAERDGGVYALVDVIDDDTLEALSDPRRKQYVSLGAGRNCTDSTGKRWPWALYELSLVAIPAFESGQQPMRPANEKDLALFDFTPHRAEVRIAANRKQLYTLTNPGGMPAKLQEASAMNDEVLQMIEEMRGVIASCMERLAALEAVKAEAGYTEMADDAGVGVEDESAMLRAQLAAVRLIASNPSLAPIESALVTLSLVNPADAKLVASHFPATSGKLPVVARKVTASAQASNLANGGADNVHRRALDIQAASHAAGAPITFDLALTRARRANTPE